MPPLPRAAPKPPKARIKAEAAKAARAPAVTVVDSPVPQPLAEWRVSFHVELEAADFDQAAAKALAQLRASSGETAEVWQIMRGTGFENGAVVDQLAGPEAVECGGEVHNDDGLEWKKEFAKYGDLLARKIAHGCAIDCDECR